MKFTIQQNGEYLYITLEGQEGQIVIKAESDGFVVDIFNDQGESVASTYALYNELEGE